MNYKQDDQEIKDQLVKETAEVAKLKEDTWKKIENELTKDAKKKLKRNRKLKLFIRMAAMVLGITIIWISLTTSPGLALIQNIKDMFAPEKDVEIHLEGELESTHVELEANEALRYIIYIDKERYKLIEGETRDQIVMVEELEDDFPEVVMEIIPTEGTLEAAISMLKEEIKNLDMEITREGKVDEPLDAYEIGAIGKDTEGENGVLGKHWDTPVHQYYITNNKAGHFFIIKEKYFLEAAEGHGARFYYMLETFEVVE